MERYDDAWVKKLADDARRKGGLVTSRFEDCKTVFDVLEVLDEIMWVLPKEERAKPKLPARSPLTADELRRLMPGVPDPALAALVLRAQLIAHPDHWRPRLVVNNPGVDASSSKLSAKQLRQAISLGAQMAKADALLMLARKARQVAEHDRRRPRLVWDRGRGIIE
ncbi:MAG: hypothetical protein WB689_38660 [Xanthobacteraceae bacterium]